MNGTAREQAERSASLRAPALGSETVTVYLTSAEVGELMYGLNLIPHHRPGHDMRAALARKLEIIATQLPTL